MVEVRSVWITRNSEMSYRNEDFWKALGYDTTFYIIHEFLQSLNQAHCIHCSKVKCCIS